jgi:hypothetical protein
MLRLSVASLSVWLTLAARYARHTKPKPKLNRSRKGGEFAIPERIVWREVGVLLIFRLVTDHILVRSKNR